MLVIGISTAGGSRRMKIEPSPSVLSQRTFAAHGFGEPFDDREAEPDGGLAAGRPGAELGVFAEKFLLILVADAGALGRRLAHSIHPPRSAG